MLSVEIRYGLARAFRSHRRSAFQRGYESALEAALNNDREFLPGDAERLRVMDRLHAYSYFLEGLLPVLDRPECATAFRNGVDRAGRYLREIAPVIRAFGCLRAGASGPAAGDALGALPLDLSAARMRPSRRPVSKSTIKRSTHQRRIPVRPQKGRKLPFANPVSTAFCVQALALWEDRNAGQPLAPRQALI